MLFMQELPPEHPDEPSKLCPNCLSPLVIREDEWVCFTCSYSEAVRRQMEPQSGPGC